MFGFTRAKRAKKLSEKLGVAQEAIHKITITQLELGSAFDDPLRQQRLMSPYGFGYVFGFADALIGAAGLVDETSSLAQPTVAHERIFGTDQGSKILGKSLTLQGSPQFDAGRQKGADEAQRFLRGGQFVPTGLVDYLSGAG